MKEINDEKDWTQTGSRCIERCGILILEPAGTVIPFENVKSFNTLRITLTWKQSKNIFRHPEWSTNLQIPPPASRCDSLTKLSTFLSLPMADLVQPSSFITASTSSRKGGAYSGWVAKLNKAFENAWEHVWVALSARTTEFGYHCRSVDTCKVHKQHANS